MIDFEIRNTLQRAFKLTEGINSYEDGYGSWINLQMEHSGYTELFTDPTMKGLIQKINRKLKYFDTYMKYEIIPKKGVQNENRLN